MAIDVYLQIDGIKGESQDDKHKDWIELTGVHWGIHQPRSATASTAGGHTAERVEMSDISFSKLADLSSPILAQTCAAGKTIPKAKLEFFRADGDGVRVKYFEVELENVLVGMVKPHLGGGCVLPDRDRQPQVLQDQVEIHPAEDRRGQRWEYCRWLGFGREQGRVRYAMAIDIEKFVKSLRDHAFTDHHGQGKCGEYVRKALQAGGAHFNEYGPPHYGTLYGLTLERLGFHEITVDDPDHFPFIRGDVMVMQPHRGGNQAGHVAGYDGKSWISDFFQTDFWAGPQYRNQRPRPSYAVYRY